MAVGHWPDCRFAGGRWMRLAGLAGLAGAGRRTRTPRRRSRTGTAPGATPSAPAALTLTVNGGALTAPARTGDGERNSCPACAQCLLVTGAPRFTVLDQWPEQAAGGSIATAQEDIANAQVSFKKPTSA